MWNKKLPSLMIVILMTTFELWTNPRLNHLSSDQMHWFYSTTARVKAPPVGQLTEATVYCSAVHWRQKARVLPPSTPPPIPVCGAGEPSAAFPKSTLKAHKTRSCDSSVIATIEESMICHETLHVSRAHLTTNEGFCSEEKRIVLEL